MEPIIELTHVSKTFHAQNGEVEALRDISLSIEKGDILALSDYPAQEKVHWYVV